MNPCVIGFFSSDVSPPTVAARRWPINEMACNYVLITSKNVVGSGGGGVAGGLRLLSFTSLVPFHHSGVGQKGGRAVNYTYTHTHTRRALFQWK